MTDEFDPYEIKDKMKTLPELLIELGTLREQNRVLNKKLSYIRQTVESKKWFKITILKQILYGDMK